MVCRKATIAQYSNEALHHWRKALESAGTGVGRGHMGKRMTTAMFRALQRAPESHWQVDNKITLTGSPRRGVSGCVRLENESHASLACG
ncbi:hypothetical protein E2C01_029307 [Portunus trituberculatus]|uniref:Uncharacterized protein n=1 Tax=Portunus trituberculatus TaxID=210409 RepID=A0A5B7EMY6_PORTR|nr:hypothetical protein [Portunus trituberculatus]